MVARYLLAKGGQVWLFGSNKDEPVTTAINSQTDNRCVDLAGRTSLGEAVAHLNHLYFNDRITREAGPEEAFLWRKKQA